MFSSIARFFDRLEDKVRIKLSHRSIIYAFIGGVAHVIFWRGIWHTSDMIMQGYGWMENLDGTMVKGFWNILFYEPITIIWSSIILLMTGLFVATFIGERIVISGLKKEKKVTDRTEEEVRAEESKIRRVEDKMDVLMNEIITLKDELVKK
jgi:hypothetical protein